MDLRRGGPWFNSIFFSRIDSHCDRIHSSLTAVCCFDNGYVGKQSDAWKEYCMEYLFKEFQESMDMCTGCRDITEILLKMALNTIQSKFSFDAFCVIPLFMTIYPFFTPDNMAKSWTPNGICCFHF